MRSRLRGWGTSERRLWPAATLVGSVAVAATAWSVLATPAAILTLLSFGTVALVSRDVPEQLVGRLADEVERLESGEYDVDLPADADGDLGRLCDAIDGLATQLRQADSADERDDHYRKRLYRITSAAHLSDEEKIERILELGCERLGVDSGAVTRIDTDSDDYEIQFAAGNGFVEAGTVTDLSTAFCRRTITSDDVLGIYDVVATGDEDDPGHREWGIGCYMGGKILVDDELYGTVCFVDPDRREHPFTDAEKAFVDLVSRWISHVFERRERRAELAQYREFTDDVLDAVDDLFYVVDGSGSFRRWNDTLCEVTGYSDEEIASTVATELVVEDDRETVLGAIEEVLDSGHYRIEADVLTKSGESIPYEFVAATVESPDGETLIAGIGRDISARKARMRALREREDELSRTKDLLQQAQHVAGVGGWELDLRTDPYTMTWTDEMYRLHDLPPDTDATMESAIEFLHPEDQPLVHRVIGNVLDTGEGYDMEARLTTATGSQRWVRAIGEPVWEDGTIVKLRGSVQDITDQKERELALETLQETAAALLTTETETEVADLVVETAGDLLDTSGVCLYLLDDEHNRLEPVSAAAGFETLVGEPRPVDAGGDSTLWKCFTSGHRVVVDTDQFLGATVGGGLAVPVGDHGVLVAVTDEGGFGTEGRRLFETLVATTRAALDRIDSEAKLRDREIELAAQNRRLQRQIQITDIIRTIHQSLITADSRDEIERAVCDRLADVDWIEFAWIGGLDPAGASVVPRTWAGTDHDYLDVVSLAADGDEPAAVTARTDAVTVVPNVVDGLHDEAWRQDSLSREFHSVIAVPLALEEYSHGVLAVYASDPGAFGDLERTVFAELGEGIANALTAVETRRALHADTLTELTLRIEDDDDELLTRIARETGCTVEYEGLVTASGDRTRFFLSTDGAAAADIEALLSEMVAVDDVRLIEVEDRCLFEVVVSNSSLVTLLVRHGGTPRSIRTTDDGLAVVVDVPTTTDVREFVDALADHYSRVDLESRRDVERDSHTRTELVSLLLDRLTDRQREVLRTAYYAGFFDWPRTSTGEEVAEMLDVSQPTINRHLRHAQKRLLDGIFEEDEE